MSGRERGSKLTLFSYVLGERVTPLCREVMARASCAGPCGVLINDIGFGEHLRSYLREGLDGVVVDYAYRKACAEKDMKICQMGQIPEAKSIPKMLDPVVYGRAAQLLEVADSALCDAVVREQFEAVAYERYLALIRELIVPALISEYLESSWNSSPIVYLEKKQRNRSMRRLKSKRGSYNWHEVREALRLNPLAVLALEDLDSRLLQGGVGAPRCRAILLSLFEDISLQYDELRVMMDSRLSVAIEEAQQVYGNVSLSLPPNIPFRLRWSLSFVNEFWDDEF